MEQFHSELCKALGIEPKANAHLMSPGVLAYMGDTVFDMAVRTMLINTHDAKPHALHIMSARRVKASAQAKAIDCIYDSLDDSEKEIYKRGRNTRPGTVAKNASLDDYCNATGFEALLGYLYLSGKQERLFILLKAALDMLAGEDKMPPKAFKK